MDGALVPEDYPSIGPSARLSCREPSPRLTVHLESGWNPITEAGAQTAMTKELVHRTWRLAVTVGPLVAIALSLAAGLKWR